MRRGNLAVVEAPARLRQPVPDDLARLRRRVAAAGGTTREAVLLDLLEDDLLVAEGALGALAEHLGRMARAVREGRAARRELDALAHASAPDARVDDLADSIAALRRRLAQLAARLPA